VYMGEKTRTKMNHAKKPKGHDCGGKKIEILSPLLVEEVCMKSTKEEETRGGVRRV